MPGLSRSAPVSTRSRSRSRPLRSKALAVTEQGRVIGTERGLRLVPDAAVGQVPNGIELPLPSTDKPAESLPISLDGIARRYDADTADFVALQLEYAWEQTP